MSELTYEDPSQGNAWRMRMYSACRAAGLNPCNPEELKLFFERATRAAGLEGLPVLGGNHYGQYVASMELIEKIDSWRKNERSCRRTPQPMIAPHVRWYMDMVLEPATPLRSWKWARLKQRLLNSIQAIIASTTPMPATG
jgi:hypothetical protein